MDEKKRIRHYIRWFTVPKKLITLVLFLLGLGFAALAIWIAGLPAPEPAPFDAWSDRGTHYASLDVIGVSDWVAQYDKTKYYVLLGSDYEVCAAIIPNADYAGLLHQNRFYNQETDEEQVKHLTGMNKPIPTQVRDSFMEVCELNEDEFEEYFGTRLFVVGESPKENAANLWAFLSVFAFGGALSLLLIGLIKGATERKAIKRLEERGMLELAAAELDAPDTRQELKDRFRLGSRFLFGRGMGLAAAWDDVLWVYRASISYNYIVNLKRFVVCTADRKNHMLNYRKRETDEICALMDAFSERNPDMDLGYSPEKRRAWQQACKERG